ncbi:MAG: zinc-dependent alcohol dehydrogenase family protein [Candidatus Marinimicrobia bacterium]|nr:zinc-dependent alcohol dehydrogenase family protein [Candidatus Neomarinimicrobiota bacterium]
MKAMQLTKKTNVAVDLHPLNAAGLPVPVPKEDELLIKIQTCAVCHTELDEIEGRTPPPQYPVVPGHQVVGTVAEIGIGVQGFSIGERVGVAWLFSSCGTCEYCLSDNENLCADFKATGRDVDGGYAEYMVVPEKSVFRIPEIFSDLEAAPLLCAGAIGYRSLRLCNLKDGQRLGLTGFGASAHLVLKIVRYKYPYSKVYVFARSETERRFARETGAAWAGDTSDVPPELCHAIIDTTPAWKPIVEALKNLRPGGRLVINAIRKEEIDKDSLLKLDYSNHLWMEKEIKSVANVSRRDIIEFLDLAAEIPIKPAVTEYSLGAANKALYELKRGGNRGAKVLRISSSE